MISQKAPCPLLGFPQNCSPTQMRTVKWAASCIHTHLSSLACSPVRSSMHVHMYVFGTMHCYNSCGSASIPQSRYRMGPPSTLPFCNHAHPNVPPGVSGNPQPLSVSLLLSFQEHYTRGTTQYWPCRTGFSPSASLEGLPRGVAM